MARELSYSQISKSRPQWSLIHLPPSSFWGSILGPLLFIIYINTLAELHLSPGSSLILYADDILLYRAVGNRYDNILLQQDVDLISAWIESSGLAINASKSTLLIISRKLEKPQIHLSINSTPLTTVESAKYLGVTITSDLKWSTHITNTCNSAKRKLGLIYRNFHQADQRSLTHLYKALVLPKLDYTTLYLHNISNSTVLMKPFHSNNMECQS